MNNEALPTAWLRSLLAKALTEGRAFLEARTFNAVTGKEYDEDALLKFGETIFNQQRAILLREGRNPDEDDMVADFEKIFASQQR